MAMDFSQLAFLQQYLTNSTWVLADLFFVGLSLWNIIVHFNIGLIGTLFRFVSYIVAFFIAKFLTHQAAVYLSLKDILSLGIIAAVTFILFAYVLNKVLRYFSPGPLSLLDSLIGGIWGVLETALFFLLLNTICICVNDKGLGVPEWILVANGRKDQKDATNTEKPEIIFSIIKVSSQRANIILPVDKVSSAFEWFKYNILPEITTGVKSNGVPTATPAPTVVAPVIASKTI